MEDRDITEIALKQGIDEEVEDQLDAHIMKQIKVLLDLRENSNSEWVVNSMVHEFSLKIAISKDERVDLSIQYYNNKKEA